MSAQNVKAEISGRYRLLSPIGSGGMGTVWHAEDSLLQRDVAVKEVAIPPGVAGAETDSIRKRVLRETRAAAALNHPNAVTVFDVIEEDGKAYIVMECISGRTLEEIVDADGPIDEGRLRGIASDVLSALEAAHSAGIVHRDVKPANVMITRDGQTKLADFGIASVKGDPKITASGLILGSPSYMAPEQATQGEGGPHADMWGLGATLYFAHEGVPPFEKQGPIPTLTAVVGDDPRPLQRSSSLVPVIEALLAKDPETRPDSYEVRRMLTGDAPAPTRQAPAPRTIALDEITTPSQTEPTRDDKRGRPWLAWLVAAGLALLAAVLIAMFVGRDDGGEVADDQRPKDKKEAPAANAEDGSDTTVTENAAPPATWETYEDPSIGYSLRYPAGWTVDVDDEQNTYFRDPETGSYLQVAWTQPPTADTPEAAWESFSESFGNTHEGYVELGITPTTFKGMDAAELEFTYTDDGAQLHGLDLGFITTDGATGMALYFQTHEENWESSQALFDQLKAGFQPPR